MGNKILNSAYIDTPIGKMIAIGDEEKLYLLEFTERRKLEPEIERLKLTINADIIPGKTDSINSIEKELKAYFSGDLKYFKTEIFMWGTSFQKLVWQELLCIPYGDTRSYLGQAKSMNKPTAFRAVANANGCNQIAIVIPCHRIINSNGKLGGYAAGIERKLWLLNHEKKILGLGE